MKDCEGAFTPPAPADALPLCLLAARTADSRPSAPAHVTVSSRPPAVTCHRYRVRHRRAKFRQRVRGDAFSPCGLRIHRVIFNALPLTPASGPPRLEEILCAMLLSFVAARGGVAVANEAVSNSPRRPAGQCIGRAKHCLSTNQEAGKDDEARGILRISTRPKARSP
jgi:hypothetical protein